MKKLNKLNCGVLVLFIISMILILMDMITLFIATIKGLVPGFTWLGFMSFTVACLIANESLGYLMDVANKKRK